MSGVIAEAKGSYGESRYASAAAKTMPMINIKLNSAAGILPKLLQS